MKINKVIIHCADTPADMDIGAAEIRDWHVNDNGWSDIGYNYVIRRDGVTEPGRDLDGDGDVEDEVGAHAAGFNRGSIGVCMVGGRPAANFTSVQWSALEFLVTDILQRHDLTTDDVYGHHDLNPEKPCPMFDAREWAKTLKV